MPTEKIMSDWRRGATHPVYWLEGDEPYHIDKLVNVADSMLLKPEEVGFNLTVFYGKDAKVEDVINACRRYPMFAERQVVIIREAQQLKDIDRLESYISHPLASTILIVAFKDKKLDGRGKLAKILKAKSVLVTTKKLYENELPEWTAQLVKTKDLEIQNKALHMLVDHIGNDLQRIENEIEKVSINLQGRKTITEDDIESFVGVSKEFNIFELQSAVALKDLSRTLRILNFFESNPKAGPIQLILPVLYAFFSKLYLAYSSNSRDEYSIAAALGLKPYFAKQYVSAMQKYSSFEVEKVLVLLNDSNLKSLGIGRADSSDAGILREFAVKIMVQS
jgi:DNA polymerase-3 subunit delta